MNVENLLRKLVICLLTVLWLKMAYDLVFDFGPDSARSWFGLHAVISMTCFALLISASNLYLLVHRDLCCVTDTLTKQKKAVIVIAFLSSLFGCWASPSVIKFVDMYFIIPGIIVLLIISTERETKRTNRLAILGLSLLLLIPNDACKNPQNWWWVKKLGLSPLTYAMPVNAMLLLTAKGGGKLISVMVYALVCMYFIACVYHRWTGGY